MEKPIANPDSNPETKRTDRFGANTIVNEEATEILIAGRGSSQHSSVAASSSERPRKFSHPKIRDVRYRAHKTKCLSFFNWPRVLVLLFCCNFWG